jgi:DNA mismatch endonuclease (patch repair protein)
MDFFTKRKRSEVMSRIRGKGNRTTELAFLRLLKNAHVSGWKRHVKKISTTPDFIFTKRKVAVFLDGCFWHGCRICGNGRIPKTNRGFWLRKIRRNQSRDRRNTETLKKAGWVVLRFWEHSLEKRSDWMILKLQKILGS